MRRARTPPPPLKVIPSGQPGAGERFLPLQNNGKEVDIDLVNNIMREPFADRFRLILNDLGAGLAARGKDLEAIVKRADPALRQTDRILHQLANQNQELARLAKDSDQVLAPLARERAQGRRLHPQRQHGRRGDRRAQRGPRGRVRRSSRRRFRRCGDRWCSCSTSPTRRRPTFADFAHAAPNITRSTEALGPFAHASTPALLTLGKAAAEASSHSSTPTRR